MNTLETLEATAHLVASYVANNPMEKAELPDLIRQVHTALVKPGSGITAKPVPYVDPKKSVRRNYIVCLEDGGRFKSMKRHLRNAFNMTPDEYRAKWRLPFDYPMVAPAYAERRSEIALKQGLGRK